MPVSVRSITLSLDCEGPPDDGSCVVFGLQDRAGDVHAGTRLPDGALRFTATVEVVDAAGGPRVRGRFVHGPASAPFAYLSCRAADGGWRFRLKVPLNEVPEAAGRASGPVELGARIRATGGGSVPLAEGWRVRSA